MLGAIVGDMVGSVYEFDNHRSKEFELLQERSHSDRGGGGPEDQKTAPLCPASRSCDSSHDANIGIHHLLWRVE